MNRSQQMVVDLVERAKKSGCWIFNANTKKWYTPEEFKTEMMRPGLYLDVGEFLRDNKLRDPFSGLQARLEFHTRLIKDIEHMLVAQDRLINDIRYKIVLQNRTSKEIEMFSKKIYDLYENNRK